MFHEEICISAGRNRGLLQHRCCGRSKARQDRGSDRRGNADDGCGDGHGDRGWQVCTGNGYFQPVGGGGQSSLHRTANDGFYHSGGRGAQFSAVTSRSRHGRSVASSSTPLCSTISSCESRASLSGCATCLTGGRIDRENRKRLGQLTSDSRSCTGGWRTANRNQRSSPRVPAGDRDARRPCARQIGWTLLSDMPAAASILCPLKWIRVRRFCHAALCAPPV
jgi:hypothetical protein